ncbi:MAG: glucose-1-phosphate adenylyltransferase, partial [Clostridia bacterium]|nr:glucose-1-phosphate adenylyltransferase [Clostridia bacterium]
PSFGIMSVDAENRITEFEEKPKHPKSNLASMGVYIFTWKVLREYLIADEKNPNSKNDFGKNIIPNMLNDHQVMLAYPFESYWKDVGTIASLWEANMDLLKVPPEFDLNDSRWKIYARSPIMPPHFIGSDAVVEQSMIAEGCEVNGSVRGSVLFAGVCVEEGALIEDSVIMPNTTVKAGAIIRRAIVAENCVIGENAIVGAEMGDIALIGQDTQLPANYTVSAGDQVDTDIINKREAEAHE